MRKLDIPENLSNGELGTLPHAAITGEGAGAREGMGPIGEGEGAGAVGEGAGAGEAGAEAVRPAATVGGIRVCRSLSADDRR